jgi:hypothetical protein
MQNVRQRRNFLKLASMIGPIGLLGFERKMFGFAVADQKSSVPEMIAADLFPTQPPELAREMVTVSHYDLHHVKELVEARPSLARAAWDWGFGDWETALGAASHMGNRPIAEYLISKGARPSLFSSAMLGHLEVIRAFVSAQAGVQRIRGPHSISLLAHAKAGGQTSRPVFDFLQSLGDAGADPLIPLSDVQSASILGSYEFGPAVNQEIDVTVDHGQMAWTRKGMMGRQLFHIGSRVFYPGGSPAVRISFREDSSTILMTIEDPQVVLVARRIQEKK